MSYLTCSFRASRQLAFIGLVIGCQLLSSCFRPFIDTRKAEYHAIFMQPTPATDGIKTVRAFMAADGQLYPDALLANSAGLANYHDCLLINYYSDSANKAALDALLVTHGLSAEAAALNASIGTRGITAQAAIAAQLALVQQALAEQKATEIKAALNNAASPGTAPYLLILIHGYNVGQVEHGADTRVTTDPSYRLSPRPYYAELRKALAPHWGSRPPAAILEVYWDGLQKNVPIGIWKKGQGNARRTGLALRQILAYIDSSTALRVLTHSSGGIVATHAFWNVISPYNPGSRKYQVLNDTFNAYYKRWPTPTHRNVRLGMIVPAMPGIAFADFTERTPQVRSSATPPMSVIIGQNRNDYAVSKFGLAPGRFGATSLGCRYTQYTDFVLPACGSNAHLVDFAQDLSKISAQPFRHGRGKLEEHSWHLYLQRPQFIEFAQLLFN